jgi:GNAT superfamily N-acetyltransferase
MRAPVVFTASAIGITARTVVDQFHLGSPEPAASDEVIAALNQAEYTVIAVHQRSQDVVGFITAKGDSIEILEVAEPYRSQGIGTSLVKRIQTIMPATTVLVESNEVVTAFCKKRGVSSPA